MMTVVLTQGKQWAESNDPVTPAGLNQTASPTVLVSGTISQLDNVSTATGLNGQPLVFNTSTQKWEPGTVAAAYLGGGTPVATNSSNVFANTHFF